MLQEWSLVGKTPRRLRHAELSRSRRSYSALSRSDDLLQARRDLLTESCLPIYHNYLLVCKRSSIVIRMQVEALPQLRGTVPVISPIPSTCTLELFLACPFAVCRTFLFFPCTGTSSAQSEGRGLVGLQESNPPTVSDADWVHALAWEGEECTIRLLDGFQMAEKDTRPNHSGRSDRTFKCLRDAGAGLRASCHTANRTDAGQCSSRWMYRHVEFWWRTPR